MRALFLLLVLANAGYFAWAQFLSNGDPGTDPQPLARELDAQKLKLVPPTGTPSLASAPAAKPAAAMPPPAAYLEWGSFALADVAEAERRLSPLAPAERLGQRRAQEQAGWWVFMPPQGSRQNALKKAAELKGLGVEDYFVIPDVGAR